MDGCALLMKTRRGGRDRDMDKGLMRDETKPRGRPVPVRVPKPKVKLSVREERLQLHPSLKLHLNFSNQPEAVFYQASDFRQLLILDMNLFC